MVGALLSKRNDVLLITRGTHLEAIRENGLRIEGYTEGVFYLEAESYYPGGFDLIILTVKAYDTQRAAEQIKEEYGGEPLITFQNGVGIVDMLSNFDVIPGVTTHGATMLSPGIVRHAGYGDTFIGEKDGRLSDRVFSIAQNFTEAGLKTEVVNDIMERRWIKAAVNACINPITAILGVKNGMLREESLSSLVKCVATECEKVLYDRGINVNVYEEVIGVIEKTSENESSMLQDVKRGRKTEVDYILLPFLRDKGCVYPLYLMVKFLEQRGEGDSNPRGQ